MEVVSFDYSLTERTLRFTGKLLWPSELAAFRRPVGLGVSHCCYRAVAVALALPASDWAWTAGWSVVFCSSVAGFRLCRLRLYAVCFRRRPLSVSGWPRGYGRRHRCGHVWCVSPVGFVAVRCCGVIVVLGMLTWQQASIYRNPQSPPHRACSLQLKRPCMSKNGMRKP